MANTPIRPYGMHPLAFQDYLLACKAAGLKPPRIVQAIGNAKASAGYHAKDGTYKGFDYTTAVDLSVRGFLGVGGYNEKQIKWLLYNMALRGFAGWYRYRKPFNTNRHIHAVYVKLHMKSQLQRQVADFLRDRDGLASHGREVFWTAPPSVDERLKAQFLLSNPSARDFF